jgi:hypothetical protein
LKINRKFKVLSLYISMSKVSESLTEAWVPIALIYKAPVGLTPIPS